MKIHFSARSIAFALIVAGAVPTAAVANDQIKAIMKQYDAAVVELKGVIQSSKDPSAANMKLDAIEKSLADLMPKLDEKKDAKEFQAAMEKVEKSSKELDALIEKSIAAKKDADQKKTAEVQAKMEKAIAETQNKSANEQRQAINKAMSEIKN